MVKLSLFKSNANNWKEKKKKKLSTFAFRFLNPNPLASNTGAAFGLNLHPGDLCPLVTNQ